MAGIIENGLGEVLLAERPPGKHLAGFWEFPGGKLEVGEDAKEALRRELQEELQIDVSTKAYLGAFTFTYEWGPIRLHVFRVEAFSVPRPTADVHRFRWCRPELIDEGQLAPADIEPLRFYRKQISSP